MAVVILLYGLLSQCQSLSYFYSTEFQIFWPLRLDEQFFWRQDERNRLPTIGSVVKNSPQTKETDSILGQENYSPTRLQLKAMDQLPDTLTPECCALQRERSHHNQKACREYCAAAPRAAKLNNQQKVG